MKKPLLLMMLAIGLLAACKKKDATPAEVSIVGKWYIKTVVNTGGPNQGTFTNFTDQDTYVFGTDNMVNISNSAQGITANMGYTYTADKVVISNSDRAETYTVTKLTTDSLVMRNTLTTVFGQPIASNNTPLYRLARK